MSTFYLKKEDDFIVQELVRFFDKVRKLHDRPGHGGYFTIADSRSGFVHRMQGIGDPETQKVFRYQHNSAEEKVRRLAGNPEHRSSFQSADLHLPAAERTRFAGSIRVGADLIFSFSGLPELLDEAVMLVLAVRTKFLSREEAAEIAMISKNEHYYTNVMMIADGRT